MSWQTMPQCVKDEPKGIFGTDGLTGAFLTVTITPI